ncbi:hypothetical protein [Streptomyces sp. H27-D2]|uniref:hypothetical protein n=1 Tax=Streptomyces sp. H27-D2 TaxID=3046304 RepID=UPI002DB7BD2B|nr:hypothetical protein [Streptomyces sp. H27-D2]MEC4016457.1 hypothetical protein [Streptomyces sp. H27-D2]
MNRLVAGPEAGAQAARVRALAVLRVRGAALGVALLPAAVAVVLLVGNATDKLGGQDAWPSVTWVVAGAALLVLLLAVAVAAVIVRASPAVSPTVEIDERKAPDLYRLVRDLADRLEVPAPSAVALTPDCDSWLEDRTHRAHTSRAAAASPSAAPRGGGRATGAPVLVIGSPFLWWMRVAELRALLAPVVAGTGPAAHPDIAAARRFVRGLDAAAAVADRHRVLGFVGWASRILLRACRDHATEMERAVASSSSERAQAVDYGLRIVAQEQVGLAYAGWDRLLTRVALPAWRMGRWPARLDAGVVSALTELSRRDRLADGFASRLGERPACDLLEEPGLVDAATSLLAARLFHGGPADPGPDWSPVDWDQYPEEVVDRKWRMEAARLHRVLDEVDDAEAHTRGATPPRPLASGRLPSPGPAPGPSPAPGPTLARVIDRLCAERGAADLLAARLDADAARSETDRPPSDWTVWSGPEGGGLPLPVIQIQQPRTGRDLLADHVTAMVCCAAVDTAGARPGLDWLDGPVLLVGGVRRPDLGLSVLSLVEDGDPEPLRGWLGGAGVRPEKPVRLV